MREMVGRGDIGSHLLGQKTEKEGICRIKDSPSILTDPAYTQTEVSVRSLEEMDKPEEEEKKIYPIK